MPRVGTIKDYPATGLMTGCGNGYYYFAHQYVKGDGYVFLTGGGGKNAWMNLNGRDVRLKVRRPPRSNETVFRFFYRWGEVLIDVRSESYKPPEQPYAAGEPASKMKITLRRGRSARIVRAVGDADC